MKTVNENWMELFENELNENEMLRVRGGGDPNEPPDGPINK
ncbi:hypothetical protein ACFLTA_03970 [Bacteroidota bacterium]